MTWIPGLLGSSLILIGLIVAACAPILDLRISRIVLRAWYEEVVKEVEAPAGGRTVQAGADPANDALAEAMLSGVASSGDLEDRSGLDVNTWAVSQERQSVVRRRGRSYLYAAAAVVIALGAAVLLSGQDASDLTYESLWTTLAVAFLVVAGLVLVRSMLPYLSARSAYRQRRLATASAKVDQAITMACRGHGGSRLEIGQLFELNRRQLDEYQLVTRKQQRSAFLLAQLASVIAFVVLVTGVLVALSAQETVDKYLTSGLTALGSLLSGFLAATFFGAVKAANEQMNRYYLEPQRTGRLLAAERIVSEMDPQGTSKAEMVTAVLGWEMPGTATTGADALAEAPQ